MRISRATINNGIKVALALALVGYLFYFLEPSAIIDAARDIKPVYVLLAVLLLPVNMVLEYFVWRPFAAQKIPDLEIRKGMGSILAGYSLGLFTPGRLGEFAGRAMFFKSRKVEIGASLAAVRLVELFMICLIGIPVFVWFSSSPFATGLSTTVANAVIAYGAFLLTLVTVTIMAPKRAMAIWGRWFFKGWREKLNVLDFYHRKSALLSVMVLASIRFLVFASQLVLCMYALIPDLTITRAYAGAVLLYFAKIIIPPVTFMDLGIREGAAAFFFGQFGYNPAAAFDAALLLFAINILLPAIIGLPLVSKLNIIED